MASTAVSESDIDLAPGDGRPRRALALTALLNVALAVGLTIAGLIATSSGLLANALDNASDAAVYAIAYAAQKRGAAWKTRAARVSGVMLLVLCFAVLGDVARRFFSGAEPVGPLMMATTVAAAVVNVGCLRLLHRLRRKDVSMRAAWTFSINDLAANLGILLAGALVAWTGQAWPDLVIGLLISIIAAKGGVEILRDAHRVSRDPTRSSA